MFYKKKKKKEPPVMEWTQTIETQNVENKATADFKVVLQTLT